MPIIPDRLRKLREEQKLSRDQLSERAKLSSRHIQRLERESASSKAVRDRTLFQLAKALSVETGVLTGELPIPERSSARRPGEGQRLQVSVPLLPKSRLAYALIKRRYHINRAAIVNMAPLFFTLLVEGSLVWRREKLKEVGEAAHKLNDLGGIAGHLSFASFGDRVLDGVADEESSIEQGDIFGEKVGDDAFDLGYDLSTNNPFADYLRNLARKIGRPDVVAVHDEDLLYGALENFPRYEICEDEMKRITGGSFTARFALTDGFARLEDIPDELWAEDAAEQRRRWLEEKVPDDYRLDVVVEPSDEDGEEVER